MPKEEAKPKLEEAPPAKEEVIDEHAYMKKKLPQLFAEKPARG